MKTRHLYVHVAFAVALAAVAFIAIRPGDPFEQVFSDWQAAENAQFAALNRARTADEARRVAAELKPQPALYAARLVDLATARPDDRGGLTGLCWAVVNAPNTEPGRRALAMLRDGRIQRADPGQLGQALDRTRTSLRTLPSPLAPLVLARAVRCYGDPRAARLLTWVCLGDFGSEQPHESPEFAEAADLLVDQFADSPDISNFCEVLGSLNGSPSWASKFESYLRVILEVNRTRLVRCSASYALARLVQNSREERRMEAEHLYEQFIKDFDASDPAIVNVEQNLLTSARSELAAIRSRRLEARAREELTSARLRGERQAGPDQ